MPRTFAYARVSTLDQDPQNQLGEIAAAGFQVEPHRIVTETISGSMSIEQRKGWDVGLSGTTKYHKGMKFASKHLCASPVSQML
jgi:hypothetical protein